ncbi:MAG TPA: hypothetical protein VMF07_07840 [Solirubrobacteraceae bacterium]|nr:hypothetical protein [Solirubrobacteraceae bacterium]
MIVVLVVGVVGILGALVALLAGRGTWESLGRDRLLMESDLHDPRAPRSAPGARAAAGPSHPSAVAERDEEIRQMLEARNRRRRRHGQPELDVEGELARLTRAPATPTAPPGETLDEELLAEIRQLVIARNHRRARRGEPPLDVEAEIARQLARLNE